MAINVTDITPLAEALHSRIIRKGSTKASTAKVTDWLLTARPRLDAGKIKLLFDGLQEMSFEANSIFGVQTADGVIVTDFSLALRDLCLSIGSLCLGKKPERDPAAIAEVLIQLCLRFFSGGSVGGAIYDSGHWEISPAWLPVPPPIPLRAISSSIDSPVSRTLHRLYVQDFDGRRDLEKAARTALDPNFQLLAVGGTSVLELNLSTVTRVSGSQLANWKPTLVYSGTSTDTSAVHRPGTFVGDQDFSDYRSGAYDDLLGEGYVLANLQIPRIFAAPGLVDRVVKDGGEYWFRRATTDLKVVGINDAVLALLQSNFVGCKIGWLDELRGFKLQNAPTRLTAVHASPLGYASIAGVFKRVSRSAVKSLALTEARRAWIRSQPHLAAKFTWLANTTASYIAKPWVDATQSGLFEELEAIT